MIAYIFPEMKDKFTKLVARASKHLSVAPTITYSEPMTKKKVTYTNWHIGGEHSTDKTVEFVTVIEVSVDDITSGDWILVANVFYKESVVGMVNAEHYKDIPANMGLRYTKCDYCGHTHPNRTRAHIIYNTVTGEWKQIGTSCGKKMFRSGDLCQFTVELYKVIECVIGYCDGADWMGWCSRVPDHSWEVGYSIDSVIAAVVGYRKEVNPEWEKAYVLSNGERVNGTTHALRAYYESRSDLVIDEAYCSKVRAFVDALPDDKWYNDYYERYEGFNYNIKRAFEAGYIKPVDLYTVFFAVKMYDESLTEGDWEKVAAQFKVGEKREFRSLTLESKTFYDDIYGSGWFCKFSTSDGVTLTKSFSNFDGFEAGFKNEDGTYSFAARVDFINNRKRTIKLGGRVSKISK